MEQRQGNQGTNYNFILVHVNTQRITLTWVGPQFSKAGKPLQSYDLLKNQKKQIFEIHI